MQDNSSSDSPKKFKLLDNGIVKNNLIPVVFSGVLDKAIFYPIDTIIIHQQDSSASTSAREISKRLWREGGIKKFYPAFKLNIATVIPLRLSVFSLYEIIKEQTQATALPLLAAMLCASVATGLAESIVFCPIDSYRTRKTLSATSHLKYHPSVMYKGFLPLSVRNSIENTIFLVGSDLLLQNLPIEYATKSVAPYITGFISGYAAQLIATPFDVIKTHKMKCPDISLRETIKSLINNHGLFRSTWLKAVRGGVLNSMMMGTSRLIQKISEADNSESKSTSNFCFKKV